MESISRNSSDLEKLEAIGISQKEEEKRKPAANYGKPVYIEELKQVIAKERTKEKSDSTIDSVNLVEVVSDDDKDADKDQDTTDWDISEIIS